MRSVGLLVVVMIGVAVASAGFAVFEGEISAFGDAGAATLSDGIEDDAVPGPLRPSAQTPAPRAGAAVRPRVPLVVGTTARTEITGWDGTLRANTAGIAGRVDVRVAPREFRLLGFSVDDPTDLEIWLVAGDRIASGEDLQNAKRVSLGRVKKATGDQIYRLPPELDLSVYRNVVLWSRRTRLLRAEALLLPRRSS